MIGRLLRRVAVLRALPDCVVAIDGASMKLTATQGGVRYAVEFKHRTDARLPFARVNLVSVRRGDEEPLTLPLVSWYWRVRATRFVRRTEKMLVMARLTEALG